MWERSLISICQDDGTDRSPDGARKPQAGASLCAPARGRDGIRPPPCTCRQIRSSFWRPGTGGGVGAMANPGQSLRFPHLFLFQISCLRRH
jgi:hypothetical protein